MQDIDSTSPAIGPADPGSRQSGQLTEGIRQLLGSIKGAALLKTINKHNTEKQNRIEKNETGCRYGSPFFRVHFRVHFLRCVCNNYIVLEI